VIPDCDVARQKFGMSWVCANSQKLDWFEAATDCHQRGGNLLVINSEYKKNMVRYLLAIYLYYIIYYIILHYIIYNIM